MQTIVWLQQIKKVNLLKAFSAINSINFVLITKIKKADTFTEIVLERELF